LGQGHQSISTVSPKVSCQHAATVPRAALAQACQCADWESLTANLLAARGTVAACWHDTFGETVEID